MWKSWVKASVKTMITNTPSFQSHNSSRVCLVHLLSKGDTYSETVLGTRYLLCKYLLLSQIYKTKNTNQSTLYQLNNYQKQKINSWVTSRVIFIGKICSRIGCFRRFSSPPTKVGAGIRQLGYNHNLFDV